MESQLQGPSHAHHHRHEQDPQHAGAHSGEDEHKSVLKKVKDKAKKIKDKISRHGHAGRGTHDLHDYEEEVEQVATDPQVHGAPLYETSVIRSTDFPTKTTNQNVTNEDLPVGPSPTAPEPREAQKTSKHDIEETKMKNGPPMGLKDDPHSPHINPPSNYPTAAGNTTGKDEAEVSPVPPLVSQFGELSVGVRPESEKNTGTHDQFTPEQTPIKTQIDPQHYQAFSQEKTDPGPKTQDHNPSGGIPDETLGGKLSAAAVSAKDVMESKLGYYGGGPHEGGGQSLSEVVSGYVEKVAETLDPVYEKLRPGEEDRALSEVVTGALAGKREEGGTTGGSRVKQSAEVAARLGPTGENKREGEDALVAGAESSGEGVVERVKDAVGSWIGMSGGVQTAQESAAKGSYLSGWGGGN